MERRGARAIGGWWVALAVLTPLAACVTGSGVRVRAQAAPGVNLTRYATYTWASPSVAEVAAARVRGTSGDIFQSLPSGPASDREALDTRIRSDVDAQLARCGYTRTRGGRPDLLIDYRVTTQEKALNDQLGEYASYRSQGGDQSLGDAFVRGTRRERSSSSSSTPRRGSGSGAAPRRPSSTRRCGTSASPRPCARCSRRFRCARRAPRPADLRRGLERANRIVAKFAPSAGRCRRLRPGAGRGCGPLPGVRTGSRVSGSSADQVRASITIAASRSRESACEPRGEIHAVADAPSRSRGRRPGRCRRTPGRSRRRPRPRDRGVAVGRRALRRARRPRGRSPSSQRPRPAPSRESRRRRTEHRHQAVADELDDAPAVVADRRRTPPRCSGSPSRTVSRRAARLRIRRVAAEVDEQHRHLALAGLELAPAGELVGDRPRARSAASAPCIRALSRSTSSCAIRASSLDSLSATVARRRRSVGV